MDESTFSSRIKELRSSLGLTQIEFAEKIGTTQATLSSYENSDKTPSLDIVKKIANTFSISIDWLLGRTERKSLTFDLNTYSDLIKLLLLIIDNSIIKQKSYLNTDNFDVSGQPFSTFCLEIDDKQIVDFYQEWKELSSIREKTPSGDKLYNIWLKDSYERFNRPLENASQYFGNIDEELPFN